MIGTAMAPKASHTSRETRPPICSTKASSAGPRPAGAGAERQPGAERGDEAVAAHRECGGVGEQAQGEDADAGEVLGGGPAPAGQLQQPPARGAGRCADAGADEQLDGRAAWAFGALQACCGGRAGDGEHDDRGGDAVVEAAFDRDQLADPRRHRRIRHHGYSECGVGRGKRRADEEGQPEPELGKEPGGQGPPEHNRQRQADSQQPHVAAHVPAQLLERQAGGVGEEHPHQGDLDNRGDSSPGATGH